MPTATRAKVVFLATVLPWPLRETWQTLGSRICVAVALQPCRRTTERSNIQKSHTTAHFRSVSTGTQNGTAVDASDYMWIRWLGDKACQWNGSTLNCRTSPGGLTNWIDFSQLGLDLWCDDSAGCLSDALCRRDGSSSSSFGSAAGSRVVRRATRPSSGKSDYATSSRTLASSVGPRPAATHSDQTKYTMPSLAKSAQGDSRRHGTQCE
jgi:hypothetical protein